MDRDRNPGGAPAKLCLNRNHTAQLFDTTSANTGMWTRRSILALFGTAAAACVPARISDNDLVSASSRRPAGLAPVPYNGMTIYVTPDYYMEDGIRMPVGLPRAWQIADAAGMIFPTTTRMVDAIWQAADIKLAPRPMTPGPQMTSLDYFRRHHAIIEGQLAGRTGLIAGHKKDVMRISRNSSRVAIYGWHRTNGNAIQPYDATTHGATYRDYSHGLRLVYPYGYQADGTRVALA